MHHARIRGTRELKRTYQFVRVVDEMKLPRDGVRWKCDGVRSRWKWMDPIGVPGVGGFVTFTSMNIVSKINR